MSDPYRNRKAKHPPPHKGRKANRRDAGPQPKKKPKRKELRAEAHSRTMETPRESDEDCRWPRLGRPVRWVRRHHVEIGVLLALLAIVVTLVGPIIKAALYPPPKLPGATTLVEALRFVPQVKRSGGETWGNAAEVQDQDDRVVMGMRLENPASQPITGLVGRASLPAAFLPNGQCRYGVNQLAAEPCQGSPYVESGLPLPNLQPGDWVHLVFEAEIPADIPGSRYVVGMIINSDQTGEVKKATEVKVPSTVAEETVRDLFSQTESEKEFWDGEPKMAPRSKRLLIGRWSDLALEKVYSFKEISGKSSVSLSDFFYDHTHEGQIVRLHGRITDPPSAFPKSSRVVKQSYEVAAAGEEPRVRCYTWRPADRLLRRGDQLEIKAIPIAWSPSGEDKKLTMAVCLAVRLVGRGEP